jgi:hypothetical protein
MNTSKIKEVVSVKPFTNSFGTTQYHCLIMDNGDEINIGKKDIQKVGWELTYELTGGDDSQQRFKKAKAAKKEEGAPQANKPYSPAIASAQTDPAVWRKKDIAIIMQNALTQANNFYGMVGYDAKDKQECLNQLLNTANIIAEHVIKKSGI